MQALHFGAGSIGRGFIGDLLKESGYDLTFVDTNIKLNEQMQQQGGYDIYTIEKGYQLKFIPIKLALSPVTQRDEVIRQCITADIITTAVWADNLGKIAPLLLAGLQARQRAGKPKINVIVCENALFNGHILRQELLNLGEKEVDSLASFPNTAVDRMVLSAERNGKNVIDVGEDFELVIERQALTNPESKPILGATYTDNLQKYLERKLYIINGGHAWAGYVGHLKGYDTMPQIFSDSLLVDEIKESMRETARLLHVKYGFPMDSLEKYIQFVVNRFCTPGVVDTVKRVCRSPVGKLAPGDRLTGPCEQCEAAGLPTDYLVKGIAAALHYYDPADEQSNELRNYIKMHNISQAITHFTGIKENTRIHDEIVFNYASMMN
ncbi:hypothetical protein RCE89_20385 [Klebsiella pneumoniae]|nr:hypothetical protein [Klebsiella pneumoniae]MDQ5657737.1 hypothetical protein [Klebsiella pneumoniae]MDQ5727756.1 hypothetical protein [Klebsiella pneumoniae]